MIFEVTGSSRNDPSSAVGKSVKITLSTNQVVQGQIYCLEPMLGIVVLLYKNDLILLQIQHILTCEIIHQTPVVEPKLQARTAQDTSKYIQKQVENRMEFINKQGVGVAKDAQVLWTQ